MPKRKTDVPAVYTGFAFQTQVFLCRLLKTLNTVDTVFIECFDDVSIKSSDGAITAIQAKQYSESNPLSDYSEAFWKTIYNWTNLYDDESAMLKTKQNRFVLVTRNNHKCGNIINQIIEQKENAFEILQKQELHKNTKNTNLKSYITQIFDSENTKHIFAKFELINGIDCNQELEQLLPQRGFSKEQTKYVKNYFLGWVHNLLSQKINSKLVPCISNEEFIKELEKIHVNINAKHPIFAIARTIKPDILETELEQHYSKTYVRQLQIIDSPKNILEKSIKDYLKTLNLYTTVINAGKLDEDQFHEYKDLLVAHWNNVLQLTWSEKIHPTLSLEGRGLLTYNKCLEKEIPFFGETNTIPYLQNGTYQELSDNLTVGWHPKFDEKLKKNE